MEILGVGLASGLQSRSNTLGTEAALPSDWNPLRAECVSLLRLVAHPNTVVSCLFSDYPMPETVLFKQCINSF